MRMTLKETLFKRPFGRRLFLALGGVFFIGFSLSLLIPVNLGTDPCTGFNLAVTGKLHMSMGNWQLLMNAFLFLFVVIFNRRLIGFGTVANMVFVGYIIDFFRYLWDVMLPDGFFEPALTRGIILIAAITLFVFSAGCYIAADLGVAPYDAIPLLVYERQNRLSFKTVRILYDATFMILGFVIGRQGGLVTILMVFSMGPVIAFVKEKVEGFLK